MDVGPRHHQWKYDGKYSCKLLEDDGFNDPLVMDAGQTQIMNPGTIDLSKRQEESVYAEAVKLRKQV